MAVKTYTLTITEDQAKSLSLACDLLQRVQLGQWKEIIDWLPLERPTNYEKLHKDCSTIGSILSQHMKEGIDGLYSSLSIGNPELPRCNGVLYDIHQVIRHKLAWEHAVEKGIIENEDSPRKWPEMMQINYDEPTRWGDEPLCKMERINND